MSKFRVGLCARRRLLAARRLGIGVEGFREGSVLRQRACGCTPLICSRIPPLEINYYYLSIPAFVQELLPWKLIIITLVSLHLFKNSFPGNFLSIPGGFVCRLRACGCISPSSNLSQKCAQMCLLGASCSMLTPPFRPIPGTAGAAH